MNQVHKMTTPGDLVSALPAMFGFMPKDSIVVLCFSGEKNRLGMRARIDIPHIKQLVALDNLAQMLSKNKAERVMLISLADDPAEEAVDYLADALRDLDIEVMETVHADEHAWYSYPIMAGDLGIEYRLDSPVLLAAIEEGRPVLSSREELVSRYESVNNMLTVAVDECLSTMEPDDYSPEKLVDIGQMLQASGDVSKAETIMALFLCASVTPVRDAMWSDMTRENASDLEEKWRQVAIHVPSYTEELGACAYAMCGFAGWLSGDGARAMSAIDRALTLDPEYSMAQLVKELIEGGVNPSTWTSFNTDDQ